MRLKNTYRLFLFLSAFALIGNSFAQTLTCAYCNKEIKGDYLQVESSYYHPAHFLCKYCNKPINGSFSKYEGKYYHAECAKSFVLLKCDVCNKSLEGEYFQDLYDHRYHAYHLKNMERCDNCDRLISDNITNGGKTFNDGRHLCSICLNNAVKSESTYSYLLTKVASKLKGLGVYIDMSDVSVEPVDRNGLKRAAGKSYNDYTRGFCRIESTSTTFNRSTTITKKYRIFVLNKIPSIYVESTLAHELMHVWLDQNTNNEHSDELEEGSCHFIAYKYLNIVGGEEAMQIAKFLMNDKSPVYGDGVRKVFGVFNQRYLVELLNYLKENRTL